MPIKGLTTEKNPVMSCGVRCDNVSALAVRLEQTLTDYKIIKTAHLPNGRVVLSQLLSNYGSLVLVSHWQWQPESWEWLLLGMWTEESCVPWLRSQEAQFIRKWGFKLSEHKQITNPPDSYEEWHKECREKNAQLDEADAKAVADLLGKTEEDSQ
jgi:hypothetical protein